MKEPKGFVIEVAAFEDERVKLIEALPSGDETLIIFFRMVALAAKANAGGFILMQCTIPYSADMLATLFNRKPQSVKYAITALKEFGMISESESGFRVTDFEKFLPAEDVQRLKTRERVEKHREKQKELPAPKKKRVYEENGVEMVLSKLLFQKMRENNPEAKEPNFQTWANEVRLMIERDNRTADQIKNMILWCQNDVFWKANILSTKKLRDKYDQLKVRALEDYRKGQSGGSARQRQTDDVFNNLLGGSGDGIQAGRIGHEND